MIHRTSIARVGAASPHLRRFPFALALTAALTGCQTDSGAPPTLTLEEAKKVTATFQGATFTPPPRTIGDITAILDKEKRADPEAAARFRAAASREPRIGILRHQLAKFYWERGQAAGKIGKTRQELADLKEAERLSQGTLGETRAEILWDLAMAGIFAGNFADAQRHYVESLRHIPHDKVGMRLAKSAVVAFVFAEGGDLEAADRYLGEAESLYAKAVTWRLAAQYGNVWTRNLRRAEGKILHYKGRYAEAEPVLRTALAAAEREYERGGHGKNDALVLDLTRTDLARTLMRLGRVIEAEIEARKALTSSLRRLGRYSRDTAHMVKWLSTMIGAQGRHAEAEALARAVIDIYQQIGAPEDSFRLAAARGELAGLLLNQGRWQAALEQFDAVKKGLADDPETFDKFFAHDLGWALALVGAGRADEAQAVATAALTRNRRIVGEDHDDTLEAEGVLAVALAKLGQREQALAAFSRAVPALLSGSRTEDDERTTQAAQGKRLAMILESYIGVLADIRGTAAERQAGIDAAAEAFRIAEVARSQGVQRALAAASARAAARDPALAELARREQDAQKQVDALYGMLTAMLSAPTDQRSPKAIEDLRARIDQLRGARVALGREIEARFPDYANLINPKPTTVADARAVLRPGEALLATYVGVDRTYVWAIPKQGAVAFAAAAVGREALSRTVAVLRADLEPNAQTLGDIPDFDLATAHGLYASLLAPVEAGWKGARSLLVVAHGPLGYLPLSLLPTGKAALGAKKEPLFANYRDVPWLARTHAVTQLPSVASLRTLRGLPAGDAQRRPFAGFGDPWFSAADAAPPAAQRTAAVAAPGPVTTRGLPLRLRAAPATQKSASADLALLPRLPDTADEVNSIALAMKADLTQSVFLGRDASESRIKSMDLSGFRVLAFATHGLVPGDLDGLTQPALAFTSPKLTGDAEDGLLTMGEILGLRLNADWVVLSACNTGSGEGAGAEAVSGLGRAFFYAGTRALLVSNWPVETTSAKALTTGLFRLQAEDPGLSRAEALRRAMVALIDGRGYVDAATGRTVYSYAHPIFWAPFTLVGDGGGARPGS